MKCLIVIPHIFEPRDGSLYSSQTESKRVEKIKGLKKATIGNLNKHGDYHWIHASLGRNSRVVTRKVNTNIEMSIKMQIYTKKEASLTYTLPEDKRLEVINVDNIPSMSIPKLASRRLLEQSSEYDIVGYMEDDLIIEDPEFFAKIRYLQSILPNNYTVLPHRCEHIPGKGDVILSGDPDGGRKDLFWDTKETIDIKWPTGTKKIYRATNPHSGCFFISRNQAKKVLDHWKKRNWESPFELSGPLEQAASGLLIENIKLMKTIPKDYRFLMIRHHDELWKRHAFEENG